MALGCKWCCNSYGIISYPIRISLSEIRMASRDAYQKLCGLIADPGSSYVKPIYKTAESVDGSSLARKKKAASHKLQAASLTRLKDSVG